MHIEQISSAQNPKIRNLLLLQEKSRVRRQQSLFVVEGQREFTHALEGGYLPESIFFCEQHISEEEVRTLLSTTGHTTDTAPQKILSEQSLSGIKFYSVAPSLYEKIAYRGTTEGIIAQMRMKMKGLESLSLPENPLILVLESVEKPGNLGAVIRTADAAGVDAVIVCDPLTDLYNPNLIRSSIGGIFTCNIVTAESSAAISWLKFHKINILTAQLQDSSLYYDIDMKQATAIVVGAEDKGLSQEWRQASDAKIRIPMLGRLDSLNVSVSASILCYEAVRQRQSK